MTDEEMIVRIDDMICQLIAARQKAGASNDIITVTSAAAGLIMGMVQEPDYADAYKLAGVRINALCSAGRLRGGEPGNPLVVVPRWER